MDEREATSIVALLQAAYPTPAWHASTIQLFVSELMPLPSGLLEEARRFVRLRQGEFAPSLASLLGALVEQADRIPSFPSAWAEMKSKADTGDYFTKEPPSFSHPVIDEFVRMLDWETFTRSDPNDGFFRGRAAELWERAVYARTNQVLGNLQLMSGRKALP